MWEVRRLRLLQELAVRGTIAQVAESLHQTPSSVSQQLSLLEREVGRPLLRKVGRRLVLTAQAEILVAHTERILSELEAAESAVAASVENPGGTVRLAVFQSAALALLPRALTVLAERHPAVRLTVTQREPETALREAWARDFDLVVAEQYPGHAAPWYAGLDREHLTTDRLRLAVPQHGRLATIDSMDAAAVAPWVMEPVGAASRHWAEQRCREAGFEPDVRYETADLQAHVALIESGHAVALLPGLLPSGRTPAIRLLDLAGHPSRGLFTAVRSSSRGNPGIEAVRTVLREVAARS